jgi:hypothetical protein
MKPLCRKQIMGLFDAETPPCVTFYLPIVSEHFVRSLSDSIEQLVTLARHEIAIRYSPHQAEKLLMKIDDIPLEELANKYKGDTLALFASPDFEGYVMLKGHHPKAYRVGDSFFLKPISDKLMQPLTQFGQLLSGRGHPPLWFHAAEPL